MAEMLWSVFDIDRACAALYCQPCDMAIAGIGRARLFSTPTPDGVIPESFQIIDPERLIP
ncbi:hypothetical protein U5A82_13450 [Sphingobium sp. CR2-8]|uniref:hypothetical protein n=1 Tax=Sphingobium sp. CR2-8 TaxID=1306534 RepID=UPI002DBD0B9B|nr:hypothetical protein [Sphingobium sp. CR2-8]MEC3911430.1 hypothetical protein [Sphingobium sp. CR2-8]